MDNFIIRWYNQNRKTIWIFIITFIMIVFVIQSINNYYKNETKDKSSSTKSTTAYNTNSYSIITEEKINDTVAENLSNLIQKFFYLCNNENIEDAYKLLSKECKEELYPTINDFKTKYYDIIFDKKRSYNSMLWITNNVYNTYRLEIFEDMLASGKKDEMPIEEYYTTVYEDKQYKLNIHGYIGKENLNTSKTRDNITIDIISKKIYMDYEVYEIRVTNNTGKKLVFNTKENTDSIYIQDENELKYMSYINEISDSEFEILYGETKTYNIRFNRGYKPTINIEKIVFEDINGENTIVIGI